MVVAVGGDGTINEVASSWVPIPYWGLFRLDQAMAWRVFANPYGY
jgi:polysaccharide pyruvyl transferase WcaK-like protein